MVCLGSFGEGIINVAYVGPFWVGIIPWSWNPDATILGFQWPPQKSVILAYLWLYQE